MDSTSVAISGGGHRASLFGLGVLLYLADARMNVRVTSISSVSGGSITNGYVAKTVDYPTTDGPTFRSKMRPLARTLALKGTFQTGVPIRPLPILVGVLASAVLTFEILALETVLAQVGLFVVLSALVGYLFMGRALGTIVGRLFGMVAIATASLALAVPVVLPGFGWAWSMARVVVAIAILMVWAQLVFGLRGALCRHAYRKSLFPEAGDRAQLSAYARSLDHIFCATEIQTADHFYLSPKFVASYLLGVGQPDGIDLVSAVQASTAMPGAFPPQRRKRAPLKLSYPSDKLPPPDQRPNPQPKRIHLVDGGVYDNMGDQWASGYANRAKRWPDLDKTGHRPTELIVVNASRAAPFRKLPTPLLPGIAELLAFGRDIDVMYDQTTSQRRLALVDRFESGNGLRGALVHIGQNPFGVPAFYAKANHPDPNRAERARAALVKLQSLGVTADEWDEIRNATATVPTTLAPIGDGASARLLWHAYVLAAVNLHVILDYPLIDLPKQEGFLAFVGNDGTAAAPAV